MFVFEEVFPTRGAYGLRVRADFKGFHFIFDKNPEAKDEDTPPSHKASICSLWAANDIINSLEEILRDDVGVVYNLVTNTPSVLDEFIDLRAQGEYIVIVCRNLIDTDRAAMINREELGILVRGMKDFFNWDV